MARIFERFERGVEQRSGGFGIGLWIVRNICVAMGGTVTVESEARRRCVFHGHAAATLWNTTWQRRTGASQVSEQRMAFGTTADRHPGA